MSNAHRLVAVFDACINTRDLEGLARMMSPDHCFIDSAGNAIVGKDACVEAWSVFFRSFPQYRNHFEAVLSRGNTVTMIGYTVCPGFPALEGPALWTADTGEGKLTKWRVYEDTPEERRRLGIDDE